MAVHSVVYQLNHPRYPLIQPRRHLSPGWDCNHQPNLQFWPMVTLQGVPLLPDTSGIRFPCRILRHSVGTFSSLFYNFESWKSHSIDLSRPFWKWVLAHPRRAHSTPVRSAKDLHQRASSKQLVNATLVSVNSIRQSMWIIAHKSKKSYNKFQRKSKILIGPA